MISNDDMQDLLKIVKSLEDSGLLLDGITKTVKNEVKEQKDGFFINASRYFRSFFAWRPINKEFIRQRCYKSWRRNN